MTDGCVTATQVPYADSPVRNELVLRLAAGEAPAGYPLLDFDQSPRTARFAPGVMNALLAYNDNLGNKLPGGSGNERLVITGQQPGLLTGPLYTIWKAMSAIRLAEELSRRWNKPVTPAFWIATEDHDLLEVNRVRVGGKTFVADHIETQMTGPKPPVGWISLAGQRDRMLAFLRQQLRGDFTADVIDRIAQADWTNYATLFATLLLKVLGPGRIMLVDPMALREPAQPVLRNAIENWSAIEAGFAHGNERLRQTGFQPQLENVGLFQFIDGRRISIDAKASVENDAWLSAGAGVRPVLQDALLPTVCTIGGPAEMLYLWQIGGVYEAMGVQRSMLCPRSSVTLIDSTTRKLGERFGLNGADIFKALKQADTYDQRAAETVDGELRQQRDRLLAELAKITGGEQTQRRVEKARRSVAYQIGKVLTAAGRDQMAAEGMDRGALMQIVNTLSPDGPQERVANIWDFVARHGWDWIKQAEQKLDVAKIVHTMMDLPD